MTLATRSLPVPLSPVMSTVDPGLVATLRTSAFTRCMASLSPMIDATPNGCASVSRSVRNSRRSRVASSARSTRTATSSRSKGFVEVLERAGFHRADDDLDVLVRREHEHRQIGIELVDPSAGPPGRLRPAAGNRGARHRRGHRAGRGPGPPIPASRISWPSSRSRSASDQRMSSSSSTIRICRADMRLESIGWTRAVRAGHADGGDDRRHVKRLLHDVRGAGLQAPLRRSRTTPRPRAPAPERRAGADRRARGGTSRRRPAGGGRGAMTRGSRSRRPTAVLGVGAGRRDLARHSPPRGSPPPSDQRISGSSSTTQNGRPWERSPAVAAVFRGVGHGRPDSGPKKRSFTNHRRTGIQSPGQGVREGVRDDSGHAASRRADCQPRSRSGSSRRRCSSALATRSTACTSA